MGKFFISFLFAACISSPGYAQGALCDLKRDSDGIKVYTCKTENEKFRLLRAEFELSNISLEELKAFLRDVPNYVTWQYNTIESEMLPGSTENEMAYRAIVDAPWPVENRELVLKVRVEHGAAVTHFFIQSFDYGKPPPDNVIRVPFFDAAWEIIKGDNKLKITYTLRIDVGGSVPPWLANLAMAEGPFVSFKELKAQLETKEVPSINRN